jgi:hypothetical protein
MFFKALIFNKNIDYTIGLNLISDNLIIPFS